MISPRYQYSRIKGILLLASAFALIPMISTEAPGAQMDVIPSIRLQEEWQSNVFDTSTNEVSSFGTRLTPGLAFKLTSVDNVMLRLSGNYEKIWYYDPEAKNADYNTWFFRVDSTGGWKLTPNFSMLPSVYFVNTGNSYRRTELVPSGDPVVPPVAIANYGNTKSQEFGGGVGFDYLATPNLTIGISGKYSEQRFPGDNVAGSGLTNATQAGGSASVSYLFSPRTKIGDNRWSGTSNLRKQPGLPIPCPAGSCSVTSSPPRFASMEPWESRISGKGSPPGSRRSKNPRHRVTSMSPTPARRSPPTRLDLTFIPAGADSGKPPANGPPVLRSPNQFTREWSGNLTGAYQVSRSVFETDAVDLATMYGTAGLRYQPWEWGSVDLTGTLNRQRSNGQVGETLNNHSVLLGVTIGKPYNIF